LSPPKWPLEWRERESGNGLGLFLQSWSLGPCMGQRINGKHSTVWSGLRKECIHAFLSVSNCILGNVIKKKDRNLEEAATFSVAIETVLPITANIKQTTSK